MAINPNEVMSKKDVKSFEELERDAQTLSQTILDHERDVSDRRAIDLDHVRKLLRFYKVRLDEISDSLYNEEQGGNNFGGGDYWSKRG
jgi:hypothetical protein